MKQLHLHFISLPALLLAVVVGVLVVGRLLVPLQLEDELHHEAGHVAHWRLALRQKSNSLNVKEITYL